MFDSERRAGMIILKLWLCSAGLRRSPCNPGHFDRRCWTKMGLPACTTGLRRYLSIAMEPGVSEGDPPASPPADLEVAGYSPAWTRWWGMERDGAGPAPSESWAA